MRGCSCIRGEGKERRLCSLPEEQQGEDGDGEANKRQHDANDRDDAQGQFGCWWGRHTLHSLTNVLEDEEENY